MKYLQRYTRHVILMKYEIYLDFCNRALIENDKPELWSYMNIIPVPKSGDLRNTNNYRGISLMCIIAKMYNRLILNRIRSAIDPKLRYNQNGFRPKRTIVAITHNYRGSKGKSPSSSHNFNRLQQSL